MKKICLILGSAPNFLGGVSLYQRNLIDYARKKKLGLSFTWVFPGKENKEFNFEGIRCIQVKSCEISFLQEFDFAKKIKKIIKKERFDVINTHANWGYCLKNYVKKNNQKIVHTYHGTTYPYLKIQLEKFGFLKKTILSPLLMLAYFSERPPMKKADEIICVSEKVKKELQNLYNLNKNMKVIRTGVDTNKFGKISKKEARKALGLDNDTVYGFYSGRGGYWNKGLDRAISIGKEIYKKNKNFKLLVVGAEKENCKKYLKEQFVIHKGVVDRKNISKYYSACDFFFSLSRYEGGAPTLVNGEAMASGCFIVFSKDSRPEIIENGKHGLIIENFGKESANKVIKILETPKKLRLIKNSAKKKVKEFNLNSWGDKYFKILIK